MIGQLLKSYEYFPKQEGETERKIVVSDYQGEFEIRMIIYINDNKYQAISTISRFEYQNLKTTDISEVLLRRVCRKYSDDFEV